MRRPRTTTLASLALLVATSTALGACGGDDSGAQEGMTVQATPTGATGVDQVCTAARQLSSVVQTVATDLQNGNVSAARAALPAAAAAATELKASLDRLQADESAKVRPQVEALKTQVQQARDSASPEELRTALTEAASTVSGLASTLSTDLRCPAE
jgi:hypothetical protein